MRKIYSLVLMAAMLLVGTNAWADNVADVTKGGSTQGFESLPLAFASVLAGETATITLLQNVELNQVILMNGGNDNSAPGKHITLNLNNHTITGTERRNCIFVLTKGYFEITGNGVITYEDYRVNHGEKWIKDECGVCVAVMGSVDPTASDWSHLVVGAGVTLEAAYAAVQLQAENTSSTYGLANNTYWTKWVDTNDLNKKNTTTNQDNKTYQDIWTNCNDISRIPSEVTGPDRKATIAQINGNYTKQRPGTGVTLGFGYGINVDIFGTLRGRLYGLQIKAQITATPKIPWQNDEAKFPKINVHPGSEIWADAANTKEFPGEGTTGYKQPTAIYASGYAIWNIQGHVEGANGVYVKMGEIVVEGGAVVKSNATDTVEMHHTSSGVSGAGNAITLQSDWSDGTMGITIKSSDGGTPRIESSAEGGAAIVETATIPNNPESQVQNITIEGGNFSGDVNGCVVISDNFDGDIDVSGGTYTGSIETLIEAMKDDSTNVIQTVVAQNGNTATVVIGQKEQGDEVADTSTEQKKQNFEFDNDMSNDIVKLDATDANIEKTLPDGTTVVKYLSLTGTGSYISQVTVENGKTLKVGQIVMNANGRIIVEAGGKLFVNGKNGVFADEVDNLILKADANHTALFVMSPTVKTNKQPKATVYIYTNACQPNATTWQWQRISIPLSTFESRTPIYTGSYTTGSSLNTWLEEWSSESGTWELVSGGWSGMRAFKGYALTNNTTAGGAVYAVKGNMQGVVDGSIQFDQAGWNFFGNSYTAPIHLRTLLDSIWTSAPEADGTIWYFNSGNQTYTYENKLKFDLGINDHVEITPLESFVIRLNEGNSAVAKAGYATSVWDYNTMTPAEFNTAHPAAAPQRVNGQTNVVRINLTAANGTSDNVILVEGENYTADYENSADAYKVMNAGMNIYAAADDNYAMVATDDILGTMISMNTNEEINYTLSFSNVRGEVYALRDNETNRVVLMNEGAIYNFTAQPNATLDGRFQIVSRQEMPTAVETIEETVAPKAIYTIMGQYVGETTDWNNLPAGVYVIDGVKVIK